MKKPVFYLACPYSNTYKHITEERVKRFGAVAAKLIKQGMIVHSPVTNHLLIEQGHDIGGDWNFWRNFSEEMVSRSDVLLVLMLPGYDQSSGVNGERAIAARNNIPIVSITEDDDLTSIYKKWMETV